MTRSICRALVRLHPARWQARFGREVELLVDDLLHESRPHRLRLVASLAVGALVAWCTASRLPRLVVPAVDEGRWGMVPRGNHVDCFLRRGLSQRSLLALDPGESVLLVMDGVSGYPSVARLRSFGLSYGVGWALGYVILHPFSPFSARGPVVPQILAGLLVGALISVSGALLGPLTRSRSVAIAVTDCGAVVFHRRLLGQTGRLLYRMPPLVPVWHPRGLTGRALQVEFAGRSLVVARGAERLLQWMAFPWIAGIGSRGAPPADR